MDIITYISFHLGEKSLISALTKTPLIPELLKQTAKLDFGDL